LPRLSRPEQAQRIETKRKLPSFAEVDFWKTVFVSLVLATATLATLAAFFHWTS
jgi:hypothetical protein